MQQSTRSFGRMELAQLNFLHPAALSLAEIQITTRGDPSPQAPHNAASALVPPRGSKHYLPTTRKALKRPFLRAFLMVLFNRNASVFLLTG